MAEFKFYFMRIVCCKFLVPIFLLVSLTVQSQSFSTLINAGGTLQDRGYRLTHDSNGDIYVTGYFNGTATFGGTTITTSGNEDVFLAKYTSAGALLWVRQGGSAGTNEWGTGVDLYETGGNTYIYISGTISGTATFGGTTVTNAGGTDIFVAKYDGNGNLQWATSMGGTSNDRTLNFGSTAVDGSGNVYVSGGFRGTASFGASSFTSTGTEASFVTKLNSSGTVQWTSVGQVSSGVLLANSVELEPSGNNVYITGYFVTGTATFGGTSLVATSGTIFLAKYNSSGTLQWAIQPATSTLSRGKGLAVDASNNIYVSGYFNGTASFGSTVLNSAGGDEIFLSKFNSSGTLQWAVKNGGTSSDQANAVALSATENNVILTGFYNGTATFGSSTVFTSQGGQDLFVVGYDRNGTMNWALSAGGTLAEEGFGIDVQNSYDAYITGFFNSTATFGASTLTAYGNSDAFISKIGVNALPVELIDFRVNKNEEKIDLLWSTYSEINNDYFVIEKSVDGIYFDAIAKIKGQGNSSTRKNYFHVDSEPTAGISYYRLKQIDYDGTFKYSTVEAVRYDEINPSAPFVVFPNPTDDVSKLKIVSPIGSSAEANILIEMYDCYGRLIYSKYNLPADLINISDFTGSSVSGLYTIKMSIGEQKYYTKVLLNR